MATQSHHPDALTRLPCPLFTHHFVHPCYLRKLMSSPHHSTILHLQAPTLVRVLDLFSSLQECRPRSLRCLPGTNHWGQTPICWAIHSPLTLILKLSGALSAFHEGPYLGPPGGGNIVDSDMKETQDDAGAFIASLKIRRFWARMNVPVVVKVEFVAFGRPM